MADEKQVGKTAPAVLPLFVSEKKKKARVAPTLPGVRDVILWTLFHAGVFPLSLAIGRAYYVLITTIFSHPASWLLPPDVKLTDAEETVASALMDGTLWCAAPQAAAAVVALMLPRRHRRLRLILAYAALLATFASHCMFTGMSTVILGADEPGFLGLYLTVDTAMVFFFEVGDVICFLGLLLRGGEQ